MAPHPAQADGWLVEWGTQIDVRIVTMRDSNPITDAMVAAYLAKYSTKGTTAAAKPAAQNTAQFVRQTMPGKKQLSSSATSGTPEPAGKPPETPCSPTLPPTRHAGDAKQDVKSWPTNTTA